MVMTDSMAFISVFINTAVIPQRSAHPLTLYSSTLQANLIAFPYSLTIVDIVVNADKKKKDHFKRLSYFFTLTLDQTIPCLNDHFLIFLRCFQS